MPLLPTEGPSIGKQGARGKTHLHSTALLPSCSMGHESAVSRTQWVPWLSSLAYKGSEDKTVIAKIQVEASLCNPTGIPEPGRPSPAKKAEGQLRRSGPRAGQARVLTLPLERVCACFPEGSPVLHCLPTFPLPASWFGGCLED